MAATLHPPWTSAPRPVAASHPATVSPRHRLFRQDALFGVLALVFLLVRVFYGFIQRVDTDEPQHLHVAWGWTQGLLPYRDFFDNHTPLFGMLCAPLLRVVGERADVVVWMRLAMVPLYLVGLGCVYQVSRTLFTRRAARWTPLLAGLYPPFFYTATEFRADALWCVLWLAAVAVLVGGTATAATPRRALAAGLILGAALAVSLKTVLMLGALGLALGAVWALRGFVEGKFPWRRPLPALAAGVAGLVVVPGLIAAYFIARGAWTPLLACTVGHQDPTGGGATAGSHTWRPLVFLVALVAMTPVALALLHTGGRRGTRRALVFLTAGFYGALLVGFWPALTRQTFLPLYPLAAVSVVAAGWAWCRRLEMAWPWARRWSPWWLPGAVVLLELTVIFALEPPWLDHAQGCTRQIGAVLRVTNPGEFVMDAKGASVFRPRPYFPVLETFTRRQLRLGQRRDDIVERLVGTGTAVVVRADLTERSQEFVDANYLPIGSGVGVAGKWLPDPDPDGETRFEVALPARYVLVSGRGAPASGLLDGETYDGQPRALAVGSHRFRPLSAGTRDGGTPRLFWAQAHERGLLPVANWSVKYVHPDRRSGK